MAEDNPFTELARVHFQEAVEQTGTQSAILAGFAFASLSSYEYNDSLSAGLQVSFLISTALTMSLEVLSLFISGLVAVRQHSSLNGHERYGIFLTWAFFFYLLGLLLLMVSLSLLAWLKFGPAAIPVSMIGGLSLIAILVLRNRLVRG